MASNTTSRLVLVVGLCVFLVSGTATWADVVLPFTENWNGETAGDDASQLAHWGYESAYGAAPAADATIVHIGGGDNVLDMNPRNAESMGIRSERALFGGSLLSVETDMQLTTDGDGAGVIGFSQNTAALNGYVLAVSRDGSGGAWVDLRKFDGDLNDSFTVGPVQVATLDPTLPHTYRLEATFSPGQIAFEVYVDNSHLTSPNLNPIDSTPHTFSDGLRFALASNFGQQAYFDDFQAIPEPAMLGLLSVGGLGLLRKRRSRRA